MQDIDVDVELGFAGKKIGPDPQIDVGLLDPDALDDVGTVRLNIGGKLREEFLGQFIAAAGLASAAAISRQETDV